MNLKRRGQEKMDIPFEITCPNCNFTINVEDIGLVMFESCTVFSCPICKKTIAIQPKGKEFEIRIEEEDEEDEEEEKNEEVEENKDRK